MKRIYLDSVGNELSYQQLNDRKQRIEWESTKFFINRLPLPVFIISRSGLRTQINSRTSDNGQHADKLYVCEQVSCSPDVKEDYIRQARQTPNTQREITHKVMIDNWQSVLTITPRYSVDVLASLSLERLEEAEGVVYLEEFDVVVMYGLKLEEMVKVHHPFSLGGYMHSSYCKVALDNLHLRKRDFTFNIRIVDNNDVFGRRWILIGDAPFCIKPSKDNSCTDGIYVAYSNNTRNGDGEDKFIIDRFDFKDSGNLPYYTLYDSREEAYAARREVQIEEAHVRVRELEVKSATAENNLRKAEQDKQNLEIETALRNAKHKQDMDKITRENEKLSREHDLYLTRQRGDMISNSRKNTIDLIKCVPVILTAVASLASMFKKK